MDNCLQISFFKSASKIAVIKSGYLWISESQTAIIDEKLASRKKTFKTNFLFVSFTKLRNMRSFTPFQQRNKSIYWFIDFCRTFLSVESWPMPAKHLKFVWVMIIEWTNRLAFRNIWFPFSNEQAKHSNHLSFLRK